ncbi:hypothetical protein ACROYT_G031950 [Oculina patagonica]
MPVCFMNIKNRGGCGDLTKTQVQGFFSRLAAKRKKGTANQVEGEVDDDDDSLIEDEIVYLDDKARREAYEQTLTGTLFDN